MTIRDDVGSRPVTLGAEKGAPDSLRTEKVLFRAIPQDAILSEDGGVAQSVERYVRNLTEPVFAGTS
jgi:hypothetical protein